MAETLAQKLCTPCRFGIPPLAPQEAARYASQVPNWALKHEGVCIERTSRFGTFREALTFVDDVGAPAEAEGHHPDVCFGWVYATVIVADEEDKRHARELLHHGRED